MSSIIYRVVFQMLQRISYCIVILSILTGVSACGQKGDLYLPDKKQSSLESPADTV